MSSQFILSALFIFFTLPLTTSGNEDAKRLYDDLMVNYNRHRRPAPPNEPVTIKLKLRLSQIIDVVGRIYNPVQCLVTDC